MVMDSDMADERWRVTGVSQDEDATGSGLLVVGCVRGLGENVGRFRLCTPSRSYTLVTISACPPSIPILPFPLAVTGRPSSRACFISLYGSSGDLLSPKNKSLLESGSKFPVLAPKRSSYA